MLSQTVLEYKLKVLDYNLKARTNGTKKWTELRKIKKQKNKKKDKKQKIKSFI